MMRREIQIFFTAIMFYTRIPCPKWVNHNADYLNLATRYFPLIGWIVALTSWLVFILSQYLFTTNISILISMGASILLTGAFHEDGLADVCDGFGGGWTQEKILEIMKDSRVGTYGAAGLVLMLLFKFFSLTELSLHHAYLFGAMLLIAHALSRFSAVTIIFTTAYAREDENSKAKPVAKQLSNTNFFIAACWAVLPLAGLVYYNNMFLLILLPTLITTFYLRRYYIKWIGGYTGDCLGATQQITEVITYLSMLALWRFI